VLQATNAGREGLGTRLYKQDFQLLRKVLKAHSTH